MKIIYRDQQWELRGQWRVRDALEEVGLIPQTVIVVRDGELLKEEATLDEDDEIKLLALISGGQGEVSQP